MILSLNATLTHAHVSLGLVAPTSIGDPAATAAIGIMTRQKHVNRRAASRATWLRAAAGSGVAVRFLVRNGPTANLQVGLQREAVQHGDLLPLPVSPESAAARVLTLLVFLLCARSLFPLARWIFKADDDTYVDLPALRWQLRQIDDFKDRSLPALFGYVAFHNFDQQYYSQRSFSYTFPDPGFWAQAIPDLNYSGKATAKTLKLCRTLPRHCQHCTNATTCSGPFPFITGWLIGANADAADALLASPGVSSELDRLDEAARSSDGPQLVFEDIWLGYAVHEHLHEPVLLVNDHSWVERRIPAKLKRTATVYHHMDSSHGFHMNMSEIEKRAREMPRHRPHLECSKLIAARPLLFDRYQVSLAPGVDRLQAFALGAPDAAPAASNVVRAGTHASARRRRLCSFI